MTASIEKRIASLEVGLCPECRKRRELEDLSEDELDLRLAELLKILLKEDPRLLEMINDGEPHEAVFGWAARPTKTLQNTRAMKVEAAGDDSKH